MNRGADVGGGGLPRQIGQKLAGSGGENAGSNGEPSQGSARGGGDSRAGLQRWREVDGDRVGPGLFQ